MGTGEGGTPTKASKTSAAAAAAAQAQEQPSTPSYTEWAAAFQAYYGPGTTPPPPGYFPSTVPSGPQPHPYMWGGQPMMPPYGTPPPPHAALYTYGGIYAHPPGAHPYGQYGLPSPSTEITMAATPASTEAEAKSAEGRDRNAMKRSKGSLGSLGMLTGKGSESAKGTSASANGHSPSGESGSEGTSEGSEDTTQNGSQKGSYEQLGMDGAQGGAAYNGQSGEGYMAAQGGGHVVGNPVNQALAVTHTAVTGKPVAGAGPTTNLNIGMDYWSGSTPHGSFPASKGKRSSSSALVPASPTPQLMGPGSSELWLQDEREMKRQRRKQSNRESARRSRLRKQAECEELSTRVDTLTVENMALRTELNRLAEECKKLSSENASLAEKVRKLEGGEEGGDGAQEEQEEEQEEEEGGGRRHEDQQQQQQPMFKNAGQEQNKSSNRGSSNSNNNSNSNSSSPNGGGARNDGREVGACSAGKAGGGLEATAHPDAAVAAGC